MFDASVTFKRGEAPVDIIMAFKGENEFLSNFHLAEVIFEERVYPATENAYFAWMSRDDHIRLRLQTMRPSAAKAFARTDEFKAQRIFKSQNELVAGMEAFVRQKFFNHRHLGDMLLATGNATLIEGNTWGDENFGFNMVTGNGRNELGKMLMRIRTELREMRRGEGA